MEIPWERFERPIKLLSLLMDEINQGSPNLRGGQSRGWAIFHWICERYDVPKNVSDAVLFGYLHWMS